MNFSFLNDSLKRQIIITKKIITLNFFLLLINYLLYATLRPLIGLIAQLTVTQ